MPAIEAIYRPLEDVAWTSELRAYAEEEFGDRITVYEEGLFAVHLVKQIELTSQVIPSSRADEVVETLRAALSSSFTSEVPVRTRGITYIPRKEPIIPLIVKLGDNDTLLDENDAIFDTLGRYRVRPKGGVKMLFQAVIGEVAIGRFDGPTKVRARLGLSDHTPKELTLGPGVIQRGQ